MKSVTVLKGTSPSKAHEIKNVGPGCIRVRPSLGGFVGLCASHPWHGLMGHSPTCGGAAAAITNGQFQLTERG